MESDYTQQLRNIAYNKVIKILNDGDVKRIKLLMSQIQQSNTTIEYTYTHTYARSSGKITKESLHCGNLNVIEIDAKNQTPIVHCESRNIQNTIQNMNVRELTTLLTEIILSYKPITQIQPKWHLRGNRVAPAKSHKEATYEITPKTYQTLSMNNFDKYTKKADNKKKKADNKVNDNTSEEIKCIKLDKIQKTHCFKATTTHYRATATKEEIKDAMFQEKFKRWQGKEKYTQQMPSNRI